MADNFSMSEKHRGILRKYRCEIAQDLLTERVLRRMSNIFSLDQQQQIQAKVTDGEKADKFLDLLPSLGKDAYSEFVHALYEVQTWMGEWLAQEGNIDINITENPIGHGGGMRKLHRNALIGFSNDFNEAKLDTEKLTNYLVETQVFDNNTRKDILKQKTPYRKIESFLDHLTKSGPKAFEIFYRCLQLYHPRLAHKFKTKSLSKYPTITFEDITVAVKEGATINIDTKFSDVPQDVQQLIFDKLNAPPNPVFENDWQLLYKKLQLPAGKENALSNQESPAKSTIETWVMKMGDKATLKILLLCLLNECDHGDLVSQVTDKLNITIGCTSTDNADTMTDAVDAMGICHIQEPIRTVREIPIKEKKALLKLLSKIDSTVVSDMAYKITGTKGYNFKTAEEFLDKIKEAKTRKLFCVSRKTGCEDLARWMRDNLPPGSTGPTKEADDQRASEMKYEHRHEITKQLYINGDWKTVASKIGIVAGTIIYMEQRSKDPADSVLCKWQVRSAATVGALYDLLVDCGFPGIADLL